MRAFHGHFEAYKERPFKSPELPALRAEVSGPAPEERRAFLLLRFRRFSRLPKSGPNPAKSPAEGYPVDLRRKAPQTGSQAATRPYICILWEA